MGNPLFTFFQLLFAVVLPMFIGAFILTIFINVLPNGYGASWVTSIYLDVFGFFDKSFFFILIFIPIIDVAVQYIRPSALKGIENIVFLLGFGYLFLNFRNIVISALSSVSFAQIMPYTYGVLTNNYIVLYIFFMLIISIVLDFQNINLSRKPAQAEASGENG